MNNTPIISKEDMAKLLGRSLTAVEKENYELYLGITVERLQDLLCLTEIPDPLPLDLQLLIARLFGIIVVEQRANLDNVQSKKVEDFSVTYDNNSTETPMITKLIQTVRLVQNGINPVLTIEGFVVTMFDGRTKMHNQVVAQLREHFGDLVFQTIIQRSIRLSEAPSYGKPIILYDVMNNGTSNYLNLAKEILDKNENSNG